MKIVFLGTPEFAAKIMEGIAGSEHSVLLAVTSPDKTVGRGRKKLTKTAVKTSAENLGIPVYETLDINCEESLKYLGSIKADICLVAAYGQKLSEAILNLYKYGSVNVHASLLPDYRGASPIQWALIKGETLTGITLFKMNKRIDKGQILAKKECPIDKKDNFKTLYEKLLKTGTELSIDTLNKYENNQLVPLAQPKGGKYYGKLTKNDGLINPDETAFDIHNRVRGLNPWPGTWLYFRGKKINIIETEIVSSDQISPDGQNKTISQNIPSYSCGAIVALLKKRGPVINTGKGFLLLKRVKMESRKEQSGYEFISGYQVKEGEMLNTSPIILH